MFVRMFVVSFALLMGIISNVSVYADEVCTPHHWVYAEETRPDGTVVRVWTNGCESHEEIVSTPEPTQVPLPTATPEPTVEPTPVVTETLPTAEPTTAAPTATPIAPSPTPVVVTAEPSPTPEPTVQWVDIVVVTNTIPGPPIPMPTQPAPTAVTVDTSVGEGVTQHTFTIQPTTVVRQGDGTTVVSIPGPAHTEVYTISVDGKVTDRAIVDSRVYLPPVTGGDHVDMVTRAQWAMEDGSSWLLYGLFAAIVLVIFGLLSLVAAWRRRS